MKNLMSKVVWLGQVLLVIVFCTNIWAQQLPEAAKPGAVEKSLQPAPQMEPMKAPDISVEEDDRGELKGGEGIKFVLKDVKFEDNWIFSPEQLKQLVKDYIGRDIEVAQLTKITTTITNYYKSKGYFLSRAYIPPQTIKDGVLLIKVREGRLGEIIIKGNKHYSRDLIRNTLKVVRGEGAVRTSDVERGLLLLMDNPGLNVKATFKPGDRPGTSDIVLDVQEDFPIRVGLDYNNFGSKYISQNRYGASIDAFNIVGLGDSLSLRGTTGDQFVNQFYYGRVEYILPLGYSGLRMGLNYHDMSYKLVGDLSFLDAKGISRGGGIWISYPIVRSRTVNWFIEAGFDMKNVEQSMADNDIGKDKLRYGHLGTTFQWIDSFGKNVASSNSFSITGFTGFAGMLDGMDQNYTNTIRLLTDVVYNKVEADFTRIQSFPLGFSLMLSAHGQYSQNRLPSSEELFIGGAGTVRGYSQAEYSGDRGWYGTAELRIPIFGLTDLKWLGTGRTVGETLQLAGFFDAGCVWISNPLPGEMSQDRAELYGAGAGLRFTYSPHVRFKVDWAKYTGGHTPRDESIQKNGAWYFQAVISY